MPDNDRLVDAINELTKQTARNAYANETLVKMQLDIKTKYKTCRACSSRIQADNGTKCQACGEDMGDG